MSVDALWDMKPDCSVYRKLKTLAAREQSWGIVHVEDKLSTLKTNQSPSNGLHTELQADTCFARGVPLFLSRTGHEITQHVRI